MLQTHSIHSLLQSCLNEKITRIGQIEFTQNFRIFHREDFGRTDLKSYEVPESAQEIARYDDAGKYRPLKTAPNLRHGWELKLNSVEELHLALDFFYPAALGLWLAWLRKKLIITPLRKTVERQSGMYRITTRISDAQAQELVQKFCGEGCLRNILWDLENSRKETFYLKNGEIPLLCSEACHLFISEARRVVKNEPVK